MYEKIKIFVMFERLPMPIGFPDELRKSAYWFVADSSDEFAWTTDISAAKDFGSLESAVSFMQSGMASRQVLDFSEGYVYRAVAHEERLVAIKTLSPVSAPTCR